MAISPLIDKSKLYPINPTIENLTIPCQQIDVPLGPPPPILPATEAGLPLILGAGLLFGFLIQKRCGDNHNLKACQKNDCQWKKNKCVPYNKEYQNLIKKLREKNAEGVPICSKGECRIGSWVAIANTKGRPPIIIHDP
jgi:hypothetical protein